MGAFGTRLGWLQAGILCSLAGLIPSRVTGFVTKLRKFQNDVVRYLATGDPRELGMDWVAVDPQSPTGQVLARNHEFRSAVLSHNWEAARSAVMRPYKGQMGLIGPVLTMGVGIITVMVTLLLFFKFEEAMPGNVTNESTYLSMRNYFLTGLLILGIGFIVIGGVFTLRALIDGLGGVQRGR